MAKSSFSGRFQEWLSEWNDAKTRQVLVVVLAVLSGLLIGMLVYTIAKYVLDQLFPFPPGIYLSTGEEKAELMKSVAAQIFVVIPVTWAIGTFAGGFLSVNVGKSGQFPAWITGILLTAYFWIDLLSLPSNTTLFIMCPVVTGLCAYAAGWAAMYRTVQRRQKAPAEA